MLALWGQRRKEDRRKPSSSSSEPMCIGPAATAYSVSVEWYDFLDEFWASTGENNIQLILSSKPKCSQLFGCALCFDPCMISIVFVFPLSIRYMKSVLEHYDMAHTQHSHTRTRWCIRYINWMHLHRVNKDELVWNEWLFSICLRLFLSPSLNVSLFLHSLFVFFVLLVCWLWTLVGFPFWLHSNWLYKHTNSCLLETCFILSKVSFLFLVFTAIHTHIR